MEPTIIYVLINDTTVGIPVMLKHGIPNLYAVGESIAKHMCPHATYLHTEQFRA